MVQNDFKNIVILHVQNQRNVTKRCYYNPSGWWTHLRLWQCLLLSGWLYKGSIWLPFHCFSKQERKLIRWVSTVRCCCWIPALALFWRLTKHCMKLSIGFGWKRKKYTNLYYMIVEVPVKIWVTPLDFQCGHCYGNFRHNYRPLFIKWPFVTMEKKPSPSHRHSSS